jgi:hypothetical protein
MPMMAAGLCPLSGSTAAVSSAAMTSVMLKSMSYIANTRPR